MCNKFTLLLILCLFAIVTGQGLLSTCNRMDVPILDKLARAACMISCKIQNCATGSCEMKDERKTCVCYRCANGSNLPLAVVAGLTSR